MARYFFSFFFLFLEIIDIISKAIKTFTYFHASKNAIYLDKISNYVLTCTTTVVCS